MTPQRLREIRKANSPTQSAFARALGYADQDAYRKYETGMRPMPILLQRVAEMIERHGMPDEWRA
jgi:transcriptional regulator with XRE-family HTH domain